NVLSGVAFDSTGVWAVGSSYDSVTVQYRTLTERCDGTQCSPITSPRPDDIATLQGVAAGPGGWWAVGALHGKTLALRAGASASDLLLMLGSPNNPAASSIGSTWSPRPSLTTVSSVPTDRVHSTNEGNVGSTRWWARAQERSSSGPASIRLPIRIRFSLDPISPRSYWRSSSRASGPTKASMMASDTSTGQIVPSKSTTMERTGTRGT